MAHERPKLKGQLRKHVGSKYARRVRSQGLLPGVVYGHHVDPAHVAVDNEQFIEALHSGAHLFDLDIEAANETCLVKDVQYDYLGSTIIHVDFARVDLSEEVEVAVPIEIEGQEQCPGLKEAGAFLETVLTDIDIRCRADSIPDAIVINIASLGAEEAFTVGEIQFPAGVVCDLPEDSNVVAIHIAKAYEDEEEAAEGDASLAEPEVISDRKEEEAEEE